MIAVRKSIYRLYVLPVNTPASLNSVSGMVDVSAMIFASSSTFSTYFLSNSATSCSHIRVMFLAALQEAHPPVFQVSHDQVPYVPESVSRASHIGSVPFPPPPPRSVATSLRRPAPQDSAQAPSPKRHASSNGRWYCPVQSCLDHCPHSSGGWASFSAMKGHCDRHLSWFFEGDPAP